MRIAILQLLLPLASAFPTRTASDDQECSQSKAYPRLLKCLTVLAALTTSSSTSTLKPFKPSFNLNTNVDVGALRPQIIAEIGDIDFGGTPQSEERFGRTVIDYYGLRKRLGLNDKEAGDATIDYFGEFTIGGKDVGEVLDKMKDAKIIDEAWKNEGQRLARENVRITTDNAMYMEKYGEPRKTLDMTKSEIRSYKKSFLDDRIAELFDDSDLNHEIANVTSEENDGESVKSKVRSSESEGKSKKGGKEKRRIPAELKKEAKASKSAKKTQNKGSHVRWNPRTKKGEIDNPDNDTGKRNTSKRDLD